MPFKSEKQKRYLWANEPEIARDWTDTYGSGIAKALGGRIPFQEGDQVDSVKHAVMLKQIDKLEKMIASGLDTDGKLQLDVDRLKATPTTGLGTGPVEEVEEPEVLDPDLTQVNKMSMIPSWEDLKYNLERLAEPGMEKFDTWEGSQGQQLYDKNYRDIKGARSFNVVPTPSEESLMMGDMDAAYGLEQMKNLWQGTTADRGFLDSQIGSRGIMDANVFPNEMVLSPMATNWSEFDDVEAQNIDAQRQMELARLANMEQYPTEEEDESGNWLANLQNYAMPAYNFMRGNVGAGLMGLVNPLAGLAMFAGGKNLKDSRFYRPATQGAYGYNPAQLNRMNALGGHYSEPARQQRRTQSRIQNMLARKAAGKSYSQKNLDALTGNQVPVDTVPKGPTKTYTPPVRHHTGGADNRNDPSSHRGGAPTHRTRDLMAYGGLANLWQR